MPASVTAAATALLQQPVRAVLRSAVAALHSHFELL
jgi:hypothetical protein